MLKNQKLTKHVVIPARLFFKLTILTLAATEVPVSLTHTSEVHEALNSPLDTNPK